MSLKTRLAILAPGFAAAFCPGEVLAGIFDRYLFRNTPGAEYSAGTSSFTFATNLDTGVVTNFATFNGSNGAWTLNVLPVPSGPISTPRNIADLTNFVTRTDTADGNDNVKTRRRVLLLMPILLGSSLTAASPPGASVLCPSPFHR